MPDIIFILLVLIAVATSGTAIGFQARRLVARNRAAQLKVAESDYRKALLSDLKPEDVQWLRSTGAVWVDSERADLDPVRVLEAAAEEERVKREAEEKRKLDLAAAELNAKRAAARQAEASRLKMEAAKAKQAREEWDRKRAASRALELARKNIEKGRIPVRHKYYERWEDVSGCDCDSCYEDWVDSEEESWSAIESNRRRRQALDAPVIAVDRVTGEVSVKRPRDAREGQEYIIKTDDKPYLKYHPIPDSWKQALEPPRPIDYDPNS